MTQEPRLLVEQAEDYSQAIKTLINARCELAYAKPLWTFVHNAIGHLERRQTALMQDTLRPSL